MPTPPRTQVVLITGASSGIGKATAERLLADGHIVYVAARRVEKMQGLTDQGATALAMDVTKTEDAERVVAQIIAEQGRIDALFNNAGFGLYGAVEDTAIDDARYQFEVNLFGLARLTQLVLPHMRAQGFGTILNTSSIGGKIYTPLGAWYHATKHALEGWSDSLRLELAPHGIRVVIVEPGIILTEFGDVMTKPMMERSGDGPYRDLAHGLAKAAEASYAKGEGSPPSVIADVVAKAIGAATPKTRYAAGHMAKPILALRRFLPDRWFDRLILSQST
ncbi:MAG: oxidoreductase [Bacteroidota bacterium]